MADEQFLPVTHDGCNQTALYLRGTVNLDDFMDPAAVRLLDGTQPSDADVIACGACGQSTWGSGPMGMPWLGSVAPRGPEFYREGDAWRMRP